MYGTDLLQHDQQARCGSKTFTAFSVTPLLEFVSNVVLKYTLVETGRKDRRHLKNISKQKLR